MLGAVLLVLSAVPTVRRLRRSAGAAAAYSTPPLPSRRGWRCWVGS